MQLIDCSFYCGKLINDSSKSQPFSQIISFFDSFIHLFAFMNVSGYIIVFKTNSFSRDVYLIILFNFFLKLQRKKAVMCPLFTNNFLSMLVYNIHFSREFTYFLTKIFSLFDRKILFYIHFFFLKVQ